MPWDRVSWADNAARSGVARLKHDRPSPLRHRAIRTILTVPGAERRFIKATRIWISAVWRSGSLAAMRSAKALRRLCLDPASDVVSAPALPERPAMVPAGLRPISGHAADLFTVRYLVEQYRQNGPLAIAAGGKRHRPDVRSGRIHHQMDRAHWRRP